MIMGEGKNPKLSHLIKLAEIGNIEKQKASQIIDEVRVAVSKWNSLAKSIGVSPHSLKMIQTSLDRVAKNAFS